jgi:hypothetical protein
MKKKPGCPIHAALFAAWVGKKAIFGAQPHKVGLNPNQAAHTATEPALNPHTPARYK